jgi:Na+/melibiose symporter-like transporter
VTADRTGEKRRKGRFWVLLVWAVIPTVLVILLTFLLRYYEFPKEVVGVLFFAVVIPAALICEKLGLGEFSIMVVARSRIGCFSVS